MIVLFKDFEIRDKLMINNDDLTSLIRSNGYSKDLLKQSESEFYLKAYVFFTHFLSGKIKLLNANLTEEDILYNRYYWLSQISKFLEKETGSDSGVSQQLFQLIEEIDAKTEVINWDLIQSIDKGIV